MIPILYEANETEFKTMGIGVMRDAESCIVVEERNGVYELELTYPANGEMLPEIQARRIIYAIPSPYRDAQPFRIYKTGKPFRGSVTAYARHISYDLSGNPVTPFQAASAAEAMEGVRAHLSLEMPFTFWTDKQTRAQLKLDTPTAARSVLGGIRGSVLDTYGGEYEWDGYTVRLWNERGNESGVTIRYGKNLTGLEQEADIGNTVTGIYPYWYDEEDGLVTCSPPILYAEGRSYEKVIPVDLSDKFKEQPTKEQLKKEAERYMEENGIGEPKISTEVSFINLEQMSGYEDLILLEKCDLCDRVTISYEALGIDVTAKIVKIQTNVLTERYESIETGNIRANVAQTIAAQEKEIREIPTKSALQKAVKNATNWITNGGGYMMAIQDENENWKEIVSLDKPDLEKAVHVWRWNNGGFGHSPNGYNGPYRTAITQDGQIVADFITTGTLNADLIKAGILKGITIQSQNGKSELEVSGANAKYRYNEKEFGATGPYGTPGKKPEEITIADMTLGISADEKSNGVAIYAKKSDGSGLFYPIARFKCEENNAEKAYSSFYGKQFFYGEEYINGSSQFNGTVKLNGKVDINNYVDLTYAMRWYQTDGKFCGKLGISGVNGDVILAGASGRNKAALGYTDGEMAGVGGIVEASTAWSDYHARVNGGLRITGDMAATGTKNRIVDVGDKKILMNAYETADCFFGDSGSGILNTDGKIRINLDETFRKTIEGDYSIFAYGYEGPVTVEEKDEVGFILAGQPGSRVDYEIRAKQKGYADCRMEEFKEEEEDHDDHDAVTDRPE